MCKFFSIVGLSLALLGGCGADSDVAQNAGTPSNQTEQSASALMSAEPATAGDKTEAEAAEAAMSRPQADDRDDNDRECRRRDDRRCEERCRYRGCRSGYCSDRGGGRYDRRCVCYRCYRGH